MAPLVSVVLPVRNGGADLSKAVATILDQTFSDLELIIINDGSTDNTAAVLDAMSDNRLRVIHQANQGLSVSLNRGVSLARGRYIARQDHDDWAKPSRIEKQVAFMEANPLCALIGTAAEIWVDDNPTTRAHDFPTDNATLQCDLLFHNPFVHSSVMLRKAALDRVGGYATDPTRQPPEDYELWSRIARSYQVANLEERLTIYREVPTSISRTGDNPFQRRVVLFCAENIAIAAGHGRPTRVHMDIAGLIHHLHDAVSASPNLAEMATVIRLAGKRIAERVGRDSIAERVEGQIENVRHSLNVLKSVRSESRGFVDGIGQSRVGRAIRRVLFR